MSLSGPASVETLPGIESQYTRFLRKKKDLSYIYLKAKHDEPMKRVWIRTAAAGAATVFLLPAGAGTRRSGAPLPKQGERPNILFFLVDDMGWQDTSEPFWRDTTPQNRTFRTPAMEAMADSAVKFTQAYASSISSPSRVSLLTGMSPAVHRVTNWTLRRDEGPDPESPTLEWPRWSVNGIAAEPKIPGTTYVTPLPELLHRAGYRTILVGKAHFGAIGTPGADPLRLGFEVNVAGHAGGGIASYLGEDNFGNRPGAGVQSPFAVPDLEAYWGEDIFATEALTIEAKKQIDTALMLDRPFFLYMSHYAVHVPFDRDRRFFQHYLDRGLDSTEAAYAALIEGMDKSLGDLRAYLRERGVADHTIVVFLSDNGGLSVGARGGKPEGANWPLRSGKGSPMEGGVRVPMMVEWPGVAEAGTNCSMPVAIQDWFPTLLEMAEAPDKRTVQRVEGQSLVPLLRREGMWSRRRPLVWHFPNMWDAEGDGIGPYSAIRMGDWKLIYYYDTRRTMLFNLDEDIFEKIDHGTNPVQAKRRERMAHRLTRELRRVGAQVPRIKSSGEWCCCPDGSAYREAEANKRGCRTGDR